MAVIEAAPHKAGLSGIAIVVDAQNRLLGVVTDGDIRSAILHGVALETPVSTIMTRDPIAVSIPTAPGEHPSENSAHPIYPSQAYETVMSMLKDSTRMLDRGAGKVVVVDGEKRVVDVISFFNLLQQADIKTRKIAVLGLGFVGLTLAVVLADAGFQVLGIEAQEKVVEMLRQGTPHFYEAGLANQLRAHVGKNLQIEISLEQAGLQNPSQKSSEKDKRSPADIYIVSVGTPVDEQHEPILTHVETACRSIGSVLKPGDTVMLRSTVPVGVTRKICLSILEKESGLKGGQDFSLVFAPERTIAGKAIKELRSLPQIVGSLDPQGAEIAAAVYREITPTIIMLDSLEAAEMVKLVNNTFRDTIFSFSNEIALVCQQYGLDVSKIIEAANEGYPRDRVPDPSPGVGGVCLKKDPYLLQVTARAAGLEPHILGQSRLVNEYMPYHVYKKYLRFCEKNGIAPRQSEVLIVGFAFKGWPETSDMRDSATLELVRLLHNEGVKLRAFDPVIEPVALDSIPGVLATSLAAGFEGASCVFIMNNHPSYEDWNLASLLEKMSRPGLFIDGWGIFRSDEIMRVPGVHFSSLSLDEW
jgi:nucleotide sugar dehydrogenase